MAFKQNYHGQPPKEVQWSSRRVSKCSGKETGYGLFLKQEGRRRFEAIHGFSWQHLDPEQQAMMGDIWQSLSEEKRMLYKKQAEELNKDPADVQRRRRDGELRRRGFAHDNPDEMAELKEYANYNNRSYKDQLRKENGYVVIPKPESSIDPKPVLDADMKSYRLKSRMDLKPIFRFDYGNLCNRTFNYVGVLNYTAMLDENNAKVLGFPAELAVVQFTLLQGVTSYRTFKIKFNINEFLRIDERNKRSSEQFEWTGMVQRKVNKFAEENRIKQSEGKSAREAFEWLLESIDTNGITVVDAVQFAAQVGTLKFLSELVGTHEQRAYFNNIYFHCLQDVALAIKDTFLHKVTRSDEEIERLLSTNMYLDKCEMYCQEHEKKFFAYDLNTYYLLQMCPMHQALSKIQLFFHFCAEHKICDFGFEDFTENHRFCTVNQETVPLYVANLSISSKAYCERHVQNGITPAPVITEEPEPEDLNIRTVEAMRMNAGLPAQQNGANPTPREHLQRPAIRVPNERISPEPAPRRGNNNPQLQNRMMDAHRRAGEAEPSKKQLPREQAINQKPVLQPDFIMNFDDVDDDTWGDFHPLYSRCIN